MATERPRNSGARSARWRTAAEVLDHLRHSPVLTRAELVRALGISSGSATEITARLRQWQLLSEKPAPVAGRGRPTTVLRAHPDGPLVLAVELRHEQSRWALAALDGHLHDVHSHRHEANDAPEVLATLCRTVRQVRDRYRGRLRAVSLAAAATVQEGRIVQSATLGWGQVDLSPLDAGADLRLLIGNDATLAGVAEARTGAAVGAHTALHLLVDVGIGGSLVVAGRPVTGATGASGEVGHLPFGDPALRCPCGATGCWDLEVDGRALARHLGETAPSDARGYAHHVLDRMERGDTQAAAAVHRVVTALGRGTAALINLYDPDAVSLGGLAIPLRAAARRTFDTALADGLMAFHRQRPVAVRDAAHGDLAALHGAAALGLDHITTEAALADWCAARVQ
jgi:predicted NBD/HSP70 family sugar kinase